MGAVRHICAALFPHNDHAYGPIKRNKLTMQELTFEELVDASMRLQPELRHSLAQLLNVTPPAPRADEASLQAEVLSEAGAYSVFAPLHDQHPHSADASDAELLAAVQSLSSEWEEEPM
jgi:hypothetical protein